MMSTLVDLAPRILRVTELAVSRLTFKRLKEDINYCVIGKSVLGPVINLLYCA
jgi:hypothetical protein